MSFAHSMEQSLNLSYLLKTWPEINPIVCRLDGKSFSSLTQVCKLFRKICGAIPLRYLAIDFCDAAEHGNKNLIDRFIAQPDGWMFEPGIGEEIPWKNNTSNTVKIFKRSLNEGVQRFLGDCSFHCINQADKIVRCFLSWKDEAFDDSSMVFASCVNINICDDVVCRASEKWLGSTSNYKAESICFLMSGENVYARHYHKIFDLFDSEETFIKKFGMLMILVLAAQKNNTTVVCSILKSLKVPDSLLLDTVMHKAFKFLCKVAIELGTKHPYGCLGYDIPDVVKKAMHSLLMQNNEVLL